MTTGYFRNPIQNIVLFVKFALACVVCSGLQCWKCIGKSCDQNPADNYRATQMTCQQGGSCMKVYYRMTENGSKILESTTRTCSAGRCVESSHQDFEKCLQTQRRYNVLGCSLRSCCHDKDLCNKAGRQTSNTAVVTLGVFICILLIYCPESVLSGDPS